MKPVTLLFAFLIILSCFSCKQNAGSNKADHKPDIPKPLQDDNKDLSLISKGRERDDLLQDLYFDMVKTHPELQKLEDQMKHFKGGREDSLTAFKNYDSKSENYYSSALVTLNDIKDSVIKQRLRVLILNSEKNYSTKTSEFTSLIKKMDDDQLPTANYYITLKIAATLPLIEEYQDKNLSGGKSVRSIVSESERLKAQTQKLAEQYLKKSESK